MIEFQQITELRLRGVERSSSEVQDIFVFYNSLEHTKIMLLKQQENYTENDSKCHPQ